MEAPEPAPARQSEPEEKTAPWRPIRFWAVVRLTDHPDPGCRWRWRKHSRKKKAVLQLVSPRGVAWDFRLNGGAWIRRMDDAEKKQ